MKKTIALLALLAAFPPLSTDMYLAAIPLLGDKWHQPLAIVNLTLVFFFITYCGFLLIYGPLSDRYGRRPPLLAGLALYIVASFLCAVADNVVMLILARTLQGAGAAAASAIVFAICKDLFAGNIRQRIFIQLGIIVAAAPMIAPIIGGWLIESLSWRWIFILQALLGMISALGVWLMNESLTVLSTESLKLVFRSYLRLMSNMPFFLLTLALACLGIPFFAFIAVSSEIYITGLGYSEKVYGYFFACNASAFLVAPLVFSRMVHHFPLGWLLPISYLGVLLSSLPMMSSAVPLPYRLTVPMWLLTFFFSFGRPPGNNLILEQVDRDAGAASSLMVFFFFITGAISMWLISLDWQDKVAVLGWLGMVSATITLLGWWGINRLFKLKLS
ncbi:MAG: MFS transporter [Proteobacteria bacterium]|nr:multidrug effflux MFS transporter [Desulfocapsa sp.]MBU3945959.1 MFS transporter [Pseudomonadota bacterium]MCG2744057.1 MFS transporter [Desulfobacteraceae bacterium]MBU4028067.1 MFS transporter [Pseudomonadota bacterium]MBU4042969.1 MFS transporter [Pseudomonadota bacterium]